ncbi:MAG: hypothetical protein K0Q50_708 [Vampirovibrio sp.]|jgi:hypothetical protein|nr:hypothetical protein [Vampirovibrio sp.]
MAGSKAARGIRSNVKTFKLKSNVSGMAQNRAETFLRPDQAVDILNMHATEEGSWSADNAGYTKINDGGTAYESGAAVDGLAVFEDSSGDKHLFMAINGKLKEVNTSTGVATDIDASAGYTVGNQVDFEAMYDVLYTVDGTINPRKWDGASAGNAAGWPVTGPFNNPKYLTKHNWRLVFLAPEEDETTFVVSDFEDPESFTFASASTDAYIGHIDGRIKGARSMHIPASNEEQTIIFSEKSTFVLTGSSAVLSDSDGFKVIKMNGNYGAINNRCIVEVGNDILALNIFGITSYSSTTQSGTIQPSAINSDRVKDVIASMNLNAKEQCWGIHLPNRREVWWFLPTGANTQCNAAIVYKYPSPGSQDEIPKWSRRLDAGSKFKMAHGALLDRTFYVGSYSGVVGSMFTASTYDGTGIPWKYEYPFWDVGNEKQNKRYLNGEAHFKVRSDQNFTFQYQWKGGGCNDQGSQSYPIETTVAGAEYGSATFGTDYFGQSEEVKVPYDIFGDGLRVKHTLSGTTADSGPEFLGLTPVLELGNISQHWL